VHTTALSGSHLRRRQLWWTDFALIRTARTETALPAWACKTRTQKCRRKISLRKVAQISGDPAEFRPQRLSAFELRPGLLFIGSRRARVARRSACGSPPPDLLQSGGTLWVRPLTVPGSPPTHWQNLAVRFKMLTKRRVGLTLGLGRSLMHGVAPKCAEAKEPGVAPRATLCPRGLGRAGRRPELMSHLQNSTAARSHRHCTSREGRWAQHQERCSRHHRAGRDRV
jgi:hypothetical protein